jgi:hypothetical protein
MHGPPTATAFLLNRFVKSPLPGSNFPGNTSDERCDAAASCCHHDGSFFICLRGPCGPGSVDIGFQAADSNFDFDTGPQRPLTWSAAIEA